MPSLQHTMAIESSFGIVAVDVEAVTAVKAVKAVEAVAPDFFMKALQQPFQQSFSQAELAHLKLQADELDAAILEKEEATFDMFFAKPEETTGKRMQYDYIIDNKLIVTSCHAMIATYHNER